MAGRSRHIPLIAVLAGALVALAIPAQAAYEPEWEECDARVTSFRASVPEQTPDTRSKFTVQWKAEFKTPDECDADDDELDERFAWVVQWNNDWRPQQWELKVAEWSSRSLAFIEMLPGRTYNLRLFLLEISADDDLEQRILERVVAEANGELTVTVPPREGRPADLETGWAVSLGDSFISGEAGRWAGNATDDLATTNDTGFTAYWDTPADEEFDYCHRSKSALIHIGNLRSMNFACSGAITESQYLNVGSDYSPEWTWRPGPLPMSENVAPPPGLTRLPSQSDMLQVFARQKKEAGQPVKLVVLSIGGNNFFFSKIVTRCVEHFLGVPGSIVDDCHEWDQARTWISSDWRAYVRDQVANSIKEVVNAMRLAGYADGSWTFIQHSYPKPIPNSWRFRYEQGFNGRQAVAGCGFTDAAADWAVDQVTPIVGDTVKAALDLVRDDTAYRQIPMFFMDPRDAFRRHELCAQSVFRLNNDSYKEYQGVESWRDSNAALFSEWVKDIDVIQQEGTELDEGFHPNYWGQLALRNCLRMMWNNGNVLGDATCRPGVSRLNNRGEPRMRVLVTPRQ